MPRKYKGLGIGGFCLPEKSVADNVTHAEMHAELKRLREAIFVIASRLGNELGSNDARRISDLLASPGERA